jgi:hypothetical protein
MGVTRHLDMLLREVKMTLVSKKESLICFVQGDAARSDRVLYNGIHAIAFVDPVVKE